MLRASFALMFLAQLLIAAFVAMLLRLLAEPQSANALVSQILILFSFFQLPLGTVLPLFAARSGGKRAALSATLMMAVLLATSAWFAAFAFLIGAPPAYLMIMFLLLIGYYMIGFFFCGRFATVALIEPRPKEEGQSKALTQNL